MRPRRKCTICGEFVSKERSTYCYSRHIPAMCDTCWKAKVAQEREQHRLQRIAEGKAILAQRRCAWCGGPIPWKDSYARKTPERYPTTCCGSCHGKWSKREAVYTREEVESRIITCIRDTGRYMGYADVCKALGIASKVLCRLGISIAELNKRCLGIAEVRVHNTIPAIAQARDILDIARELDVSPSIGYAGILAHILVCDGTHDYSVYKRDLLQDIIGSYIAYKGTYISVTGIMRELGISWDTLRGRYKIDVKRINHDLGFVDKRESWFEDEAYFILVELVGRNEVSREHSFPDCRSDRNWLLRYDFFMPRYNLLVEVDGEQHTNRANKYHTERLVQNDIIKAKYAEAHGIRLIRVSTYPSKTFSSRFRTMILDVLKAIELLEPRPDNAEGNQQPSPIGEGSETIESRAGE